jgi:acetyl-CoA C-acetyltransferase
MHAIAAAMADLRDRPGALGLVWGNGGYVTKHSFGIYGTAPAPNGFRHTSPQDEIDALPRRSLAPFGTAVGPARIEAYTVMHARDGRPETAIAACLLDDGRRAWGTATDPDTAGALCDGEWVGRAVTLDAEATLHV